MKMPIAFQSTFLLRLFLHPLDRPDRNKIDED